MPGRPDEESDPVELETEGNAATPVAPGSFEEFDLAPFRAQLRAARRLGFRLLFVLGLTFTVAGIAATAVVSSIAGFSWAYVLLVMAIFTIGGFLPLLLAYIPSREWRFPKTLRIDETGFRIIDSGGSETRFKWDQPGLVVSIHKVLVPEAPPGGPTPGEMLTIVPYALCAISKEARQALLIEAEANGMTVSEDRFAAADDDPSGRPIPSVTYTAMRLPLGGPALEPTPDPPASPVDPPPAGTDFELPKEVVPAPERSYDVPSRNPLKSMTFSGEGFAIALRNGRVRSYPWGDPRWGAGLTRRLESPLEKVAGTAAPWHISLRSPRAEGDLSAAAYEALVAEAHRRGRYVTSTRIPGPAPPHSFWIAETSIRAPPRSPGRRSR